MCATFYTYNLIERVLRELMQNCSYVDRTWRLKAYSSHFANNNLSAIALQELTLKLYSLYLVENSSGS